MILNQLIVLKNYLRKSFPEVLDVASVRILCNKTRFFFLRVSRKIYERVENDFVELENTYFNFDSNMDVTELNHNYSLSLDNIGIKHD